MRRVIRVALVIAAVMIVPRLAAAQASIAGTVKDSSGGVLPGVTVEASSPALIEKSRSVVTDGTGQYKIVDLRPGTYAVTFVLPGFNTMKRDGIELTGSFTATVNADLKVGAVEESITVTGETPIVDVQSSTRQRSLSAEVIGSIPSGRSYFDLGVLVPGVSITSNPGSSTQDVGGSKGPLPAGLVIHGAHEDGQRILYNGISLATLLGSANRAISAPNTSAYQEVTLDTGGASAELGQGGVRINFIPRDGGNVFKATTFVAYANQAMQSSNFTDDLKARGLATPGDMHRLWDVNPGFGGPIVKDKVWYFVTLRDQRAENFVPGLFYNQNENNVAAWTYVPDPNRRVINKSDWLDGQARLTYQVDPRNKVAGSFNVQSRKAFGPSATTSPEAARPGVTPSYLATLEWSSPITSRVLLEAVSMYHLEQLQILTPYLDPNLVSVTEQGGLIPGLTYRVPATYSYSQNGVVYYRAALSYVSGAHAFKVGFNDGFGWANQSTQVVVPYSFRFQNGSPNQITIRSAPEGVKNRMDHDGGIYAQDRWSLNNRLTLNLGVRYDFYSNHFPEQFVGPSTLAPNRSIAFAETDNIHWKDITPKMAATYDLFNNGRTAIKASLNKYVAGLGLGTVTAASNPAAGLVTAATRTWTDDGRNAGIANDFIPQCNLTAVAANGECGPLSNAAFGTAVVTQQYDPKLLAGWNARNADWEFSAGVQHQILPRVSAEVSYFRRWFSNFVVQDNLALDASDFTRFSITAPVNSLLPGGGGYTVNGLYDVNPAKFTTPAKQFLTLSDDYGKQIEHWNGVDVSVNARLAKLLLQGGVSTGKTVKDNCEVVPKVPEMLQLAPAGFTSLTSVYQTSATGWLPAEWCHIESPFLTQVKLLGSYTVPKVDVLVSATLQNFPGPEIAANFLVTNAIAGPSLQRLLAGNAPNIGVNIVRPMSFYEDRINQLDLRFAKVIRYKRSKSNLSIDVYNALNANPVLTENLNYTAFRVPTSILVARFAKVTWQFDF